MSRLDEDGRLVDDEHDIADAEQERAVALADRIADMTPATLAFPRPELCPMGCGCTTDDPHGGPCDRCWDDACPVERAAGVCTSRACVEPCGPNGGCVR